MQASKPFRGRLRVVVIDDEVSRNVCLTLGWEKLGVEGVGHDPTHVLLIHGIDEIQLPTGIGTREPKADPGAVPDCEL